MMKIGVIESHAYPMPRANKLLGQFVTLPFGLFGGQASSNVSWTLHILPMRMTLTSIVTPGGACTAGAHLEYLRQAGLTSNPKKF